MGSPHIFRKVPETHEWEGVERALKLLRRKSSNTGLFIFLSYFKSIVLKNCMLKGGLYMRGQVRAKVTWMVLLQM